MLVEKEKAGLHFNDEAYKMAETDALSVAMKALGVGANIYSGMSDGSKYAPKPQQQAETAKPSTTTLKEEFAEMFSIRCTKMGVPVPIKPGVKGVVLTELCGSKAAAIASVAMKIDMPLPGMAPNAPGWKVLIEAVSVYDIKSAIERAVA